MPASVYAVHGALITTQVSFGGGSVVGKLGAAFNPMLFALLHEVLASVLLWAVYCDKTHMTHSRADPSHGISSMPS
jgi:hypothetical protein